LGGVAEIRFFLPASLYAAGHAGLTREFVTGYFRFFLAGEHRRFFRVGTDSKTFSGMPAKVNRAIPIHR
jgi:hypothetical protein